MKIELDAPEENKTWTIILLLDGFMKLIVRGLQNRNELKWECGNV